VNFLEPRLDLRPQAELLRRLDAAGDRRDDGDPGCRPSHVLRGAAMSDRELPFRLGDLARRWVRENYPDLGRPVKVRVAPPVEPYLRVKQR
jgi:hypothetical protein